MIELAEAINDPEMGAVSFTVHRTSYRRSRGQLIPSNQTDTAVGCIHPGTAGMMQLLPEEERTERFIQIYTSFQLSDGDNNEAASFTGADRIDYGGKSWRVVKVQEWPGFHFYQALAVMVQEDEDE